MPPRRFAVAIAAAVLMVGAARPPTAPTRNRKALNQFIGEMADKHGFDLSRLQHAFSQAEHRPQIVELMTQSRQKKRWDEYRSIFLNAERIDGGLRFWKQNASSLEMARRRYGVPEEMITAIIGIETHLRAAHWALQGHRRLDYSRVRLSASGQDVPDRARAIPSVEP